MNQPNVKKNYAYQLFYEILALVVPFITTPYVSRVLGADGVGVYSYSSSIMTYFTMFAVLGTQSYGTREIAQHRDNKTEASKIFWEIQAMKVLTSLVTLLIWIFFIFCSMEYKLCYIALTPLLLSAMFDISWFFSGLEQIKHIVFRNSIIKIVGIACIFLFVKDKDDLVVYILIHSISMLLGNLSMWFYLPKQLVKIDYRGISINRHLRETIVYFVPTIATTVYTVLDKTLIGLITGSNYENGFYEQATKIINIIKTVVFVSVNTVMSSRISYLFAQNKYDEIHKRIEKSLDFIILIGVGCIFGLVAICRNFIPIFLGEGYDEVTVLLYLMAPLILIIGVSNCLGSQYFTPSGQRKLSAKIIIGGSVINLFFNLIMIPFWGARGATIASIIAETFIAIAYVKLSKGYASFQLLIRLSWKRMLAGTIMGFFVSLLGRLIINEYILSFMQVILGVLVYAVILILLKDAMLFELFGMVRRFLRKDKSEND